MATRLIKLADGTLVEVEAQPDQPQQISAEHARKVDEALDKVRPILINASKPLVAAWRELSEELHVEQAEIELGLGFEGEAGIPYLVKGTGSANLVIKLTLKPKQGA